MTEFLTVGSGYAVENEQAFWMKMRNNDNHIKHYSDVATQGVVAWTQIFEDHASPTSTTSTDKKTLWDTNVHLKPKRSYRLSFNGTEVQGLPGSGSPVYFTMSFVINSAVNAYTAAGITWVAFESYGPFKYETDFNSDYFSINAEGDYDLKIVTAYNGVNSEFILKASDNAPLTITLIDQGKEYGV